MKNRAFIFKIMHSIIIFLYNLTIYSVNTISKYLVFLCDLLSINNKLKIELEYVEHPYYDYKNNKIVMSEQSYSDVLLPLCLAHEVYHAYRYVNDFDDIRENSKQCNFKELDNEKYRSKEIELEAIAFQKFIMNLAGIDLDYSNSIPVLPDISKQMHIMSQNFGLDGIEDAVIFSGFKFEDLCEEYLNF